MSSVQSGSSKQPLRRFVSAAPFPRDIFSYTVVSEPYPHEVLAPVPGATVRSCPAGRVLRESGKKLYPGVNKGVKTYMVGVIDTQSGISGFIDPNSPLFALYSTDLPAVFKDGSDPGPQGKVDVGPPLYTNGNMYVAQNAKIDGTLRVNISYTNDANMETAGFSTMTGADLLAEELTVSSLKGGDLFVSTVGALDIAASSMTTGCIVGVKGRFSDGIESEAILASTILASSIGSEMLIVQAAVLSSFGGVNGGATNFSAINLSSVNTFSDEITASTLSVTSEIDTNTIYAVNISTLNGKINNLDTITIVGINVSTVNALFDSLNASSINVSTLNTDVFNLDEMNVSTLNASTIDSDEIIVSTLTADEIESDEITVSTLNASTIDSDEITVSTLTADEIESDEITVSTLNASTIDSDEIIVSTLTADEIESDEITVSTLNASTLTADEIDSDEITVSTLHASTLNADEIESDDISVSTLNASTIESDEITVSTLNADEIDSDEITVSTLYASTIESDEITVSTLNAEEINVDDLNVSTIDFSTMNGDIIEADEINVDTIHASTINSAGSIISNRQIRAVGPSGHRDPLDGSDPLIDLDIALGPFLYIAGNGDNVVTCTNFRFCDQLFLQTSGTGELTFSTGFGVSSITMEKANGMINFICDGFHMIELGRSRWNHLD